MYAITHTHAYVAFQSYFKWRGRTVGFAGASRAADADREDER
jgi:hypothetical protein